MNYVVRNKTVSCTSEYDSIISQKRWLSDRLLLAKKCLLCLISFLDLPFSVSQDGPTHREVLSTQQPTEPCWGFAKEGFWSCIHGTLFPGRSAFCQLSLKKLGVSSIPLPPVHPVWSSLFWASFSLMVWFRGVFMS